MISGTETWKVNKEMHVSYIIIKWNTLDKKEVCVGAVCTCMAAQLAFTETYQERHKVLWYTREEIKILQLQGFRQFGELWRPVSPTKEDGLCIWPRENNLTFSSRLIKMNTCRALISQQESVMCCAVWHDGKHVDVHFTLRSFNL